VQGIDRTHTQDAFRVYSQRDVESAFDMFE